MNNITMKVGDDWNDWKAIIGWRTGVELRIDPGDVYDAFDVNCIGGIKVVSFRLNGVLIV